MQKKHPRLGWLAIDLDALFSIRHECRPLHCPSPVSCCSSYEIAVSDSELEGIVGFMPAAAGYVPDLMDDDGFRNVFDEESPQSYLIEESEIGDCVFSFRNSAGCILCSLHASALDLGIEPVRVKPRACTLWPLAVQGRRPELLTVQHDAYSFPCNQRRKRPGKRLDHGVRDIITALWGDQFVKELEGLVKNPSRA